MAHPWNENSFLSNNDQGLRKQRCHRSLSRLHSLNRIHKQISQTEVNTSRQISIRVATEADKENQQPNRSDVSETVERFRRERMKKLYGQSIVSEQMKAESANEQSCLVCRHVLTRRQSQISSLEFRVRCLEQQLRDKNRLLLELQKAIHDKDSHIGSLLTNNCMISSALELLREQQSAMTKSNLQLQKNVGEINKELDRKGSENRELRKALEAYKKNLENYWSVQPKLHELEEMQDQLIEECAKLRNENEQLKQLCISMQINMPPDLNCNIHHIISE